MSEIAIGIGLVLLALGCIWIGTEFLDRRQSRWDACRGIVWGAAGVILGVVGFALFGAAVEVYMGLVTRR